MTPTTTRRCALAIAISLALAGGFAAQAQDQKAAPAAQGAAHAAASPQGPWIGTWKRNAEKSSNNMGGGSTTMKMWVEGDGFRYRMESTSPTGEVRHAGAFARFDGKPYPEEGNPSADHNVFTRVNDHTYALVDLKEGKETFRFTVTISADGKTRTSVSKSRNAKGEEVTNTGVWDRVE